MDEKKEYRVLKPVAISGIVDAGAIVLLTEAEAANIGIGEYLEEVIKAEAPAEVEAEAEVATTEEASEATGSEQGVAEAQEETPAEEVAPVTAEDSEVKTEAEAEVATEAPKQEGAAVAEGEE